MSNINVNEAGEALVRASGQVILKGLDSFFSDPENRRRFEEWKKGEGKPSQIVAQAVPEVSSVG